MLYPSSCVFLYACFGKDYAVYSLCSLDWMTSQEDHYVLGNELRVDNGVDRIIGFEIFTKSPINKNK